MHHDSRSGIHFPQLQTSSLNLSPRSHGLGEALFGTRTKARWLMWGIQYLPNGNHPAPTALSAIIGGFVMRVFLGMILGALFLVAGVYIYDSMSTSSVANGQVAQANRTIVNWDVAAVDWTALKSRAHDDWIKLSSR
jgi:hypothetical protein